jgi:ribosome-associated heat shock protein Hsp15
VAVGRAFLQDALGGAAGDRRRQGQAERRTKPAKDVKAGDRLSLHIGQYDWHITVLQVSSHRGPAPVARTLYAEDEESRVARENDIAKRRVTFEPAAARKGEGRPTKRDRRDLERWNDTE